MSHLSRFTKLFLLLAFAAAITVAFTLLNPSAEAASGPTPPSVETTYRITKQPFTDFRFDLRTGVCFEEDFDGNCVDEEVTPDPYGPVTVAAEVKFFNKVKNMPTGWNYCGADPAVNNSYVWQSFDKYQQYGMVKVPTFNWEDFDFFAAAGDGNFYDPDNNAFTLPTYVRYFANNTKKVSYQGYALICGPDASTPSGTGWKVIVGKTITLPATNRW